MIVKCACGHKIKVSLDRHEGEPPMVFIDPRHSAKPSDGDFLLYMDQAEKLGKQLLEWVKKEKSRTNGK